MPHPFRTVVTFIAAFVGGFTGTLVASEVPVYEVYAIRYATMRQFNVSNLVQGADRDRKLDIAMTVWALVGPGKRTILVDAGFYRPRFIRGDRIDDYIRPDKAVGRANIRAQDVTDIIVTHMHWDHVDGVDLFPKAQVWIQRAEFDHHTARPRRPAPDDETPPLEYTGLLKLNGEGRVRFVDGDAKEIIPGVTVYIGGKHTFESQYVGVNTRAGRMVIASDNLYLYENLDKHLPIAQTLDAKANLAAQDRMKQIATEARLIIPGHDPAVFSRFPKHAEGVARLD